MKEHSNKLMKINLILRRSFLCLLNDLTTQKKFSWNYQQMLQEVL